MRYPCFFSHYYLLSATLLPTFRYFICHFPISLNDKFGGLFLRGGVLYYTICAHVPETQKCVTFVTFVTFWHKYQRYCTVCNRSHGLLFWHKYQREVIVNMQLLCIFTELIAFFSDFVHFTLKLFKILYYLCTRNQNHRTLIALSQRYHRTHVHEQPLCDVPVALRSVKKNKIIQD